MNFQIKAIKKIHTPLTDGHAGPHGRIPVGRYLRSGGFEGGFGGENYQDIYRGAYCFFSGVLTLPSKDSGFAKYSSGFDLRVSSRY